MKDWKSIKVEGELMKNIESIIEGSKESRIGFATAAIEKEIGRIKKERYELDIQELVDEYRNNAVPYSKKGIKNLNDFASQLRTNTEEIKKLKKRVKDFDDLSMMMGGRFQLRPIIIENTKTGKKIRLATKEEVNLSKLKKIRRSTKQK